MFQNLKVCATRHTIEFIQIPGATFIIVYNPNGKFIIKFFAHLGHHIVTALLMIHPNSTKKDRYKCRVNITFRYNIQRHNHIYTNAS